MADQETKYKHSKYNDKILENIRSYFYEVGGQLYWKIQKGRKKKDSLVCQTIINSGYKRVRFDKTDHLQHRIIWMLYNDVIPENYEIDHIDRDRINNKIENLRLVNSSKNKENSNRVQKRFYPCGVRPSGRGFKAVVCVGGKYQHLGTFDTVEEANQVRNDRIKEYYNG